MHELLDNAVKSIKMGVEDFQSDDKDRVLSAIRNIYAGVLLMYKEKLCQLSPPGSEESLIKSKIVPKTAKDGSIFFVGKGRKTVDRQQILERLESCGIVIDAKRLGKIANIRNDIEHYHSNHSDAYMSEAVASAFILIRNFLTVHLQGKPLELLGEKCWNIMLENHDVFEAHKKDCMATLENVDWHAKRTHEAMQDFQCIKCGSSLVQQDDSDNKNQDDVKLKCAECGEKLDTEKVLEKALEENMFSDFYLAMTDGDDQPLEDCPECGAATFIVAEGLCANCNFNLTGYECAICGKGITPDEYSNTGSKLCSYHHHISTKDD